LRTQVGHFARSEKCANTGREQVQQKFSLNHLVGAR
jgi:hypothetical protein